MSTPTPEIAPVLAAYLQRNEVSVEDIPKAADAIKQALGVQPATAAEPEEPLPAGRIPARTLTPKEIEAAVQPDSVLCFEDSKRYKSMKRVLTTLGLTPEQYRRKWGLPANFPITAPSYSEQRKRIAIERGFGKRKPAA